MQYNVAQLLKEPAGSARDHSLDEDVAFDDGVSERVKGKVRFVRTDTGVWVHLVADVQTHLSCSRCLRAFPQTLHLDFDEEYLPTVDVTTGLSIDVPQEEREESVTIDGQHMLDLSEAMRQYRIAALPMKALCRADCRGLCPNCGANLNDGPCQCSGDRTTPRWAPLRRLLTSD